MQAAMVVMVLAFTAAAPQETAPAFTVKVEGKGSPVVLIPGLSSSGQVWAQTVATLRSQHECHIVSLAGFGGAKAIEGPFLPRVRDELIAYLKANKLQRPVLIGHSLGATLALWVAASAPSQVGGVVAVDGVAFLPALMDPSATAESVKGQAAAMQARYAQMTADQFAQANALAMQSMVTDPAHLSELLKMANLSDPRAVGQAISELLSTDLRAEVAKIQGPVLLIAAAAWATTPELEQRAVSAYQAQVAQAPKHQVVLIPKARHFVMYDAPEALLGHLRTFLGGAK